MILFCEEIVAAVGGKEANQLHFVIVPCNAGRHDFVLMQWPTFDCMFHFADWKLSAKIDFASRFPPRQLEASSLNKKMTPARPQLREAFPALCIGLD